MTRRAKKPRFHQYKTFSNTLDLYDEKLGYFAGNHVLELGCGRGEFALELASRHANQSYIGVDIKSDRMWFGAKKAQDDGVNNLVFLRSNVQDLAEIFKPDSISGIWLTFPDPYPKKSQAKHRLTSKNFLELYYQLLTNGGWLRLKTDNVPLFDWSIKQLAGSAIWKIAMNGRDLHTELPEDSDWRVITSYERKFIAAGQKIYYAEFVKS